MFAEIQDTAIATLDLDAIKVKLIHPESGEGWTREYADAMELEYRRFLFLMKKFPEEETAPLVDVDTFWHYHILDTMKYAADCEHVFGYFLHHFPYLGMRGEDDSVALAAAGNRMQELYEQTFGLGTYGAANDTAFRLEPVGPFSSVKTDKQAAYCTRTPETAYCTRVLQAAYCTRAPQAAYCTRAPQAAYCTRAPQAAYCTRAPQAAYCTRSPADAAPAADAKPAYCTRSMASQQEDGAGGVLFTRPAPEIGNRFTTRPSLTTAAM